MKEFLILMFGDLKSEKGQSAVVRKLKQAGSIRYLLRLWEGNRSPWPRGYSNLRPTYCAVRDEILVALDDIASTRLDDVVRQVQEYDEHNNDASPLALLAQLVIRSSNRGLCEALMPTIYRHYASGRPHCMYFYPEGANKGGEECQGLFTQAMEKWKTMTGHGWYPAREGMIHSLLSPPHFYNWWNIGLVHRMVEDNDFPSDWSRRQIRDFCLESARWLRAAIWDSPSAGLEMLRKLVTFLEGEAAKRA